MQAWIIKPRILLINILYETTEVRLFNISSESHDWVTADVLGQHF